MVPFVPTLIFILIQLNEFCTKKIDNNLKFYFFLCL